MYSFKEVYEYSKDLNVLYVEDDKFLLEETAEILEDIFSSITTAFDGQDGLEKYNKYKEETNSYYDLVITDINMPRLDGMALIKEIKAINYEQPIIVVSAHNESDRLINLIQSGITSFVLKPIDQKQLTTMLYGVCRSISNAQQKDKFLFSQSRLASMGEMVDSIAHQWLQPINTIKIQSEILLFDNIDGKINTQVIDEYLDKQSLQINHLVETLNEFRGFLRPNYLVETTTYKELTDSVLLLLKDTLVMNTIKTNFNFGDDESIEVVSNEFKHILINIINNAVDAFDDNKIEFDKRELIFKTYKEDDKNILTIQDSAGGIPDGVIEKIFDSNFTTKGEGKGTGVGLYMSSQIVEKIGGTLTVSNQDNGACFKIAL